MLIVSTLIGSWTIYNLLYISWTG